MTEKRAKEPEWTCELLRGCRHLDKQRPPHKCPFYVDVHNDKEFRCTCCEECEQECCDDI